MLRRPTSSADRSASSAASGSRRRTCRALVLEHDGRQPVADEVVNVTRDLSPLGDHRTLRQLAPRLRELIGEALLANERSRQDPGEGDPHDPDRDRHLRRLLDLSHQHRRRRREHAEWDCALERRGPEPHDEGEERRLEHERFELSGALRE